MTSVPVSIRRRYHLLVLTRRRESTYCRGWRAVLKLSTVFACTISSSSWFQCITLLMKNEFLYCSVLHTVVFSALELFLTELFTILALSKLSKRFGLILCFGCQVYMTYMYSIKSKPNFRNWSASGQVRWRNTPKKYVFPPKRYFSSSINSLSVHSNCRI